MEISITKIRQTFLEALAKKGLYGNTPERVIEHFIEHKLFLLSDVKEELIIALHESGYSFKWIRIHLPGNPVSNAGIINRIEGHWDEYSLKAKNSNKRVRQ